MVLLEFGEIYMNIYESWIVKSPIIQRGLHGDKVPENSISAFKQAVKNKLPIKFEVTSLADGTPVVFNDERLARMTGADGFISSLKISNFKEQKKKSQPLQKRWKLLTEKFLFLLKLKTKEKLV